MMDDLHQRIASKVEAAGTSFYSAMRLLPKERRQALFAIYAFCREIDDIADSNEPANIRKEQLDRWRKEIASLYGGQPSHEISRALMPAVSQYHLRQEDFIALIEGMEMDAEKDIWAPSLVELDLYCDRVASAVGRLSVRAFGSERAEADQVAYHLGRALQLTNILRDIKEDIERNRFYLPAELLVRHHVLADKNVLSNPSLRLVCRETAKIAEDHFGKAQEYMRQCEKGPMRPAAIMGAVYLATLRKLRKMDWQDWSKPVRVPKWQKLWLAIRYGFL